MEQCEDGGYSQPQNGLLATMWVLMLRDYEAVIKVSGVGVISRGSTYKSRKAGRGENCSVRALCRQRRVIRQGLTVHPNARILRW